MESAEVGCHLDTVLVGVLCVYDGADGGEAGPLLVGDRLAVYPYLPVMVFGAEAGVILVFVFAVTVRYIVSSRRKAACLALVEACHVEPDGGCFQHKTCF